MFATKQSPRSQQCSLSGNEIASQKALAMTTAEQLLPTSNI
jgi:hypothetical protein